MAETYAIISKSFFPTANFFSFKKIYAVYADFMPSSCIFPPRSHKSRSTEKHLRGHRNTPKCARLLPSGHAKAPNRARSTEKRLRGHRNTPKCAHLLPDGHAKPPNRARSDGRAPKSTEQAPKSTGQTPEHVGKHKKTARREACRLICYVEEDYSSFSSASYAFKSFS